MINNAQRKTFENIFLIYFFDPKVFVDVLSIRKL